MFKANAFGRWIVAICKAIYEWESTFVDRAYPPSQRTEDDDLPPALLARKKMQEARLQFALEFDLVPHPIVTNDAVDSEVIQKLEKRMRPGAISKAGFLGADESLLDVVRSDESFLISHQVSYSDITQKLHAIFSEFLVDVERRVSLPIRDATGKRDGSENDLSRRLRPRNKGAMAFLSILKSRRESGYRPLSRDEIPSESIGWTTGHFRLFLSEWCGWQECPWGDDARDVADFLILNARTGEYAVGPRLIEHLIEVHHFFEGHGTSYRVDPAHLLKVLELGV